LITASNPGKPGRRRQAYASHCSAARAPRLTDRKAVNRASSLASPPSPRFRPVRRRGFDHYPDQLHSGGGLSRL
jgi:hypothetical protein